MKELKPLERWYHGGKPGLRKGDYLLPPCETDTQSTAMYLVEHGMDPWQNGLEADRARQDKVFLCRNRDQASCHAAAWFWTERGGKGQRGALYEAVPDSCLWEPDPDNPQSCIQGYRAKIVNVIDPAFYWPLARWYAHNHRYASRPAHDVRDLDSNRWRQQERRAGR